MKIIIFYFQMNCNANKCMWKNLKNNYLVYLIHIFNLDLDLDLI